MSPIFAGILMLLGTAFVLVASIGLLRLPDLYTRMHAVTKAGTLGVGCILLSAAVAFGDLSVATRSVVALLFVLFTAPVSAHLLGRAAYLGNVSMWEGTSFDGWQANYEDLRREGEDEPDSTPEASAASSH